MNLAWDLTALLNRGWPPAGDYRPPGGRTGLVAAGLPRRGRALPKFLPRGGAGPVFKWKPGDAAPDFGQLAWTLQSRWTEPAREVTVYLATRRAASIFGGRADGRIAAAARKSVQAPFTNSASARPSAIITRSRLETNEEDP